MLSLLACLGAKPPLKAILSLPVQEYLILFELAFEAEVGQHIGPLLPNKGNGLLEAPVLLAHEVGDDQS